MSDESKELIARAKDLDKKVGAAAPTIEGVFNYGRTTRRLIVVLLGIVIVVALGGLYVVHLTGRVNENSQDIKVGLAIQKAIAAAESRVFAASCEQYNTDRAGQAELWSALFTPQEGSPPLTPPQQAKLVELQGIVAEITKPLDCTPKSPLAPPAGTTTETTKT